MALSTTEVMRQTARSLRATLRGDLRFAMRVIVSNSSLRNSLNAIYLHLRFSLLAKIHAQFSTLFRDTPANLDEGDWYVEFCGTRFVVPLRGNSIGLDWDFALALLGHDSEIKETYRHLIGSNAPPEVFIDIGSNFGTHSLLFLGKGIRALSFEPNPMCHAYFKDICGANQVVPEIIALALAERAGRVKLHFPPAEPWLGTTKDPTSIQLENPSQVVSVEVAQDTLDNQLASMCQCRMLIKIDTEGGEQAVLRGAAVTLERFRPMVIFESLRKSERKEIFGIFNSSRYHLIDLPWTGGAPTVLDFPAFRDSPRTNFAALPLGLASFS